MRNYYSEIPIKNHSGRENYAKSIAEFLHKFGDSAEIKKSHFLNPEKLNAKQGEYRRKFRDFLGFPLNIKRQLPKVEKIFVANDGDVDIYRMTFSFKCGIIAYGIYFEQVKNKNIKPFTFVLHGGEGSPEIVSSIYFNSSNYNHLARRITDMGASVFCPQLLLWNVEKYGTEYDRIETDSKLRQLGGSITALEIWIMQCELDWFIKNEKFNPEKIGVAGLSYGGMYALHLSACDKRIKSCYSCSFVHDGYYELRPDWSYKNAKNTFDIANTMALVAPRRLVVQMGDKDQLFDYKQTIKECEKAMPYYKIFNAEEQLKCIIFDGVHETDLESDGIEYFYQELK